MNHSQPTSHQPARRQPGGPRSRQDTPRRSSPLTDDQYLATSLALVANLSRRVRGGGAPRHG